MDNTSPPEQNVIHGIPAMSMDPVLSIQNSLVLNHLEHKARGYW